jgi:hypothetical protein
MSLNTFNRVEMKYVINETQYRNLKTYLTHCEDLIESTILYDEYKVVNIYYDTKTNVLIKKSVSKPKFKQKLRLRAYVDKNGKLKLFLELKKKINGYVNKRRTEISYEDLEEIIHNHSIPDLKQYHNNQILKEIVFFSKQYNLQESMYISYDREVYIVPNQNSLRITVDHDVRSSVDDISILDNHKRKYAFSENLYILEIKTNTNYPFWLTELLNKNRIYSTSFSKYGSIYYETTRKNGKDDEKWINPYLAFLN